jgi:hypothetical protein
MLALLEAQRAHLASDEHVRERAAVWRDATPEQHLAAVIEQCREAEYFLSLKDPAELERALTPLPLPDDTVAILEALQRCR